MTTANLTLRSANRKTGPIPTSITDSTTCPPVCSLRGNGCYAENWPLNVHWHHVDNGQLGVPWEMFCTMVATLPQGQLWRHNVAGDLPGEGNRINRAELRALANSNIGRRGFTYTHKPMTPANLAAVREAVGKGLVINLSADSPGAADALMHLGLPVVCVLDSGDVYRSTLHTPYGNHRIVVCPASRPDSYVTCATCGLCARADRTSIIGFPAHGARRKVINLKLKKETA